MICGAILAVRASLRKRDPEEWGIPVSRIFLTTVILYFAVCLSQAYGLPFIQSQFPEISASFNRLMKGVDVHVGSQVDPMVGAQKAILEYAQNKADAEADELNKEFSRLLIKKQNGTFTSDDQAQEDRLLATYAVWQENQRKLHEAALGQARPVTPSLNPVSSATHSAIPTRSFDEYAGLVRLGSGSTGVPTAIITDSSQDSWVDILALKLKGADPRIEPGAFNMNKLMEGDLFNKIWQGDREPLEKSGAFTHFQHVLMIRGTESCQPTNVSGTDLISCGISLRARVFRSADESVADSSIHATGAGFTEADAVEVAVDHLMPDAKASVLSLLER